jgi:hypothetical protein
LNALRAASRRLEAAREASSIFAFGQLLPQPDCTRTPSRAMRPLRDLTMNRAFRTSVILGFLALPLAPACEEGDIAPSPKPDGKAVCEELAELCHEVGEAFGGELQTCHKTAEMFDGDVCLEIEADCRAKCTAAQEDLGGGGAGGEGHGAGGQGGEHNHAGAGGESH